MEAALIRARETSPTDRVASGLTKYLEQHLLEETHGEEPGGAVLDDLAALGTDATKLISESASSKIACLVGAQYYWIRHSHPVAVLGYLELEALHPRTAAVEELIERTGLPREGFRQLLLHAQLDVGHADELHDVIDVLPLDLSHEQLIGLSALHTISLVTELLLDVVRTLPPGAARGA
jgi:Iron-containing redox enzyme